MEIKRNRRCSNALRGMRGGLERTWSDNDTRDLVLSIMDACIGAVMSAELDLNMDFHNDGGYDVE